MRRTEAARYARSSAAVALVLALATAAVYVERAWKARTERKNAPAAAAANVARESNGVTFSKGEGSRKEFTVEASKSTDFTDRNLTELEAVVITIFGKNGDRHDVIHTQSCQYGKSDGNVVCSGEVRMDLQSAADLARVAHAAPDAVPQVMHVVTQAVTFNQKSGTAMTAEPVSFSFPNGGGQGIGMEYKSEAGTVRLLRDVRLKLRPPASAVAPAKAKAKSRPPAPGSGLADAAAEDVVTVTGTSLDFDRLSRRMHVDGPAAAESKTTRLTSGELTLDLDAQFRAQTLLASGNVKDEQPKIVSQGGGGQTELSADHLAAEFSPQGWTTRVEAHGHISGVRRAAAQREVANAESATITMWPRVNEIKELELHGNVTLKTLAATTTDVRVLHTEAFRMQFSAARGDEAGKPLKAETLTPGRLEWTENNASTVTGLRPANASSVPNQARAPITAHSALTADKLQMLFAADGKAKQLQADGHVRMERTMADQPVQTATAQTGVANLLPTGAWSQMDLNGAVKLLQGQRNGQADHAVFRQAEQTATLTGRAIARDATTETAAARIVFSQATGDIRAEGAVRSTDFPVSSGAGSNAPVQLGPGPTHITSDLLQANSQSGRALYTGHARMWQGESVLEADSIELLRDSRVMNALGNVRAVFPQATAATPGNANSLSTPVLASTIATPGTGPNAAKKSPLWHLTAQSLMYSDADSHAHLEHDVVALSADQKLRAPIVDLYFTRGSTLATGVSPAPRDSPQQISRAVGTGGTTVEEGGRKAVAERGVYTATDGKFVMSGGHPTLFDGTEGNTTGRQLTFFLADDTIIVDSENGSRVLTRHRVKN
jgi:lipopolysaccharide export system protein LptA